MSTETIAISSSIPEVRPASVAWGGAIGLALVLIGAGLMSSVPLSIFGWAAAFLFFAVASDLRFHRIPNLLTLPALLVALLVSPWAGATSGPLEAMAGAALGFALLVGPYALGGMGAGDVKALMVIGAWIGPEATVGATAWAAIGGGGFALVMLVLRGELVAFARRWGRNVFSVLTFRKNSYEPPATGSIAAGGIPFAAAIAVGLAAQWYGGSPW
jgi:prepilin peptidase CpaA